MAEMTLYYWKLKARSYAILAVAKAGNVPIKNISDFDLAALKVSEPGPLPFGQLPYLVDGMILFIDYKCCIFLFR